MRTQRSFLRDFARCMLWTLAIGVVAVLLANRADAGGNQMVAPSTITAQAGQARVAPITCAQEDSCGFDWRCGWIDGARGCAWYAAQGHWEGDRFTRTSMWVKVTLTSRAH